MLWHDKFKIFLKNLNVISFIRFFFKFIRISDIRPVVKRVDTVSAEWPAVTNYLYLTYNGTETDVDVQPGAIIVIGKKSLLKGVSDKLLYI